MSELQVKVVSKNVDETTRYEGTVSIPGARPTKLTRKSDGSTWFATRAALTTAAKVFANSIGYDAVVFEGNASSRAAKRSASSSTIISC